MDKYAYTWLLTAVTGPDYIDINNDGKVNMGDYGYWVKFNYGKWTDGYIWQTPYEGNRTYKTYGKTHNAYTWGRKQIYYLNSIQTRTHTAYFVKSLREDGKGKTKIENSITYNGSDYDDSWSYNVTEKHKVLKLDAIYLLNNFDIITDIEKISPNLIEPLEGQYLNFKHSHYEWVNNGGLVQVITRTNINHPFKIYYRDNILDIHDISDETKAKAIKVIKFGYDYSLFYNTPNSDAPDKGRLTLNKLSTLGRNGYKAMPDYNFFYNSSVEYNPDFADTWGFCKGGKYEADPGAVDNGSLKEIETPLGSKIKIQYESDSYNREAAINPWNNLYKVEFVTPKAGCYYYLQFDNSNVLNAFNDNEHYSLHISYIDDNGEEIKYWEGVNVESKLTNRLEVSTTSYQQIPTKALDNGEFVITGEHCILYGGGVRVKQIDLEDETGNAYTTLYNYNDPATGATSGVTSYTPYNMEYKYIPYITELPIPNVMYEYVTVEEKGGNEISQGTTLYHFEVLGTPSSDHSIGSHFKVNDPQSFKFPTTQFTSNGTHYDVYLRNSIIEDNKAALGRVLSIKEKNSRGDEIKKTEYTYYEPEEINSGILQETFKYRKQYINYATDWIKWSLNSSSKIMYPSVLKSTESTENGYTTTLTNAKFDFNTGQLLEQWTNLPSGKTLKTETTPAYNIYNGAATDNASNIGMGSKVDNIYNKNMLVQVASEKTYEITSGQTGPLLGASVQTWENNWWYRDYINGYDDRLETNESKKVWRKQKGFAWKGEVTEDGYYNDFDATKDFDFNAPDATNLAKGWQKTSEITRYNHYSAALEAKDINNKYAASRMGVNDDKVIATAANADYLSFTYTGFEEEVTRGSLKDWGGEILGITGTRIHSKEDAHTGEYYLQLPSTGLTIPLTNFEKGRMYSASVWVRSVPVCMALSSSSGQCGSPGDVSCKTETICISAHPQTDWNLISINFKAMNGSTVTIKNVSGTENIFIDDIRVHPIDAPMQSYAYDEKTGQVTAILDNENIATKFEYDEAGRLKATYKEVPNKGFVKVSEHGYGYAYRDIVIKRNPYTNSPTTICPNAKITLYIDADNVSNYQWQRRLGNGEWVNVGSNSSSFEHQTSTGFYNYQCILTNPASSLTSGSIGVNVVPIDPVIDQQPTDQAFCNGARFRVTSSNGTSFQWYRKLGGYSNPTWVAMTVAEGGIYSVIDIDDITYNPIGTQYYCKVTTNVCFTNSINSATATLLEGPSPTLTGEITGSDDITAAPAEYIYSVQSVSGCTYAWSVPQEATIVGSQNGTSITVKFNYIPGGDPIFSGIIRVRAINECGNQSNELSITVTETPQL